MGSVTYSLTFKNETGRDPKEANSLCIFQEHPNLQQNILKLAWIAEPVVNNETIDIEWDEDYTFTAGKSGILVPGVRFRANWHKDANPTIRDKNSTGFDWISNAYRFTNTGESHTVDGGLYVDVGQNFPEDEDKVAIGIGMKGKTFCATMAEPNLGISFKLKPTYYAVFGSYKEGEVIDVQIMTNVVELKFTPITPSIELTLDPQNKWTQKYLHEANAQRAK